MFSEELLHLFCGILFKSGKATLFVIALLLIRALFRGRLDPGWRHALWGGVVAILVLPNFFSSSLSIESWSLGSANGSSAQIIKEEQQVHLSPEIFFRNDQSIVENLPVFPERASRPLAQDFERASRPLSQDFGRTGRPLSQDSVPVIHEAEKTEPLPIEISVREIIPGVWLCGIVILTQSVVYRLARLRKILSQTSSITDPLVCEELEHCRKIMRVRRKISLIESTGFDSPVLVGLFFPRIVLPCGLVETIDRNRLKHLFLHELAHWKRFDLLSGWIMSLLLIVHWFNPMLWIAVRKMNEDREEATDAFALKMLADEERPDYGTSLLSLAAWKNGDKSRFPSARFLRGSLGILGIAEPQSQPQPHSSLSRRIEMIANNTKWSKGLKYLFALSTLLVAGFLLTGAEKSQSVAEETATEKVEKVEKDDKKTESTSSDETRTKLTGRVRDDSKKPVEGATVVVQFWDGPSFVNGIGQSPPEKCLEEITLKTDSNGFYFVEVPEKYWSKKNVHVKIMVAHPDYESRGFIGEPLEEFIKLNGQTMNDEVYGDFTITRVHPISGTVLDPNGKPVAGALVSVWTWRGPGKEGKQVGEIFRSATDSEGKFRLQAYDKNGLILSINTKEYAPLVKELGKERGDLGSFTLQKGVVLAGTLLNKNGKPLAEQWVDLTDVESPFPFPQHHIWRSSLTDKDGKYRFAPVPPKQYRISVADSPMDPFLYHDPKTIEGIELENDGMETLDEIKNQISFVKPKEYPVEEVFAPHTFFLGNVRSEETFDYKAGPVSTLKFRFVDSQGKPYDRLLRFAFYGIVDNSVWNKYVEKINIDAEGRFAVDVPQNVSKGVVAIQGDGFENFFPMRYRLKPGSDVKIDWAIDLEKTNLDALGEIEIVPLEPAVLTITAFDEKGNAVPYFNREIKYTEENALYKEDGSRFGFILGLARGSSITSEEPLPVAEGEKEYVSWDKIAVLPYQEFEVIATAPNGEKVSQKHALWEGAERTIRLTLPQKKEQEQKPVLNYPKPIEESRNRTETEKNAIHPYYVEAPDIISINFNDFSDARKKTNGLDELEGNHLVAPDGYITLGEKGRVYINGLTTDECAEAIVMHLKKYYPTIQSKNVSVEVFAFNSKEYFVILRADSGDQVHALPYTGNETMDNIRKEYNLSPYSNKLVWIARPVGNSMKPLIIPVSGFEYPEEMKKIKLLPGDRVFISDKKEKEEEQMKEFKQRFSESSQALPPIPARFGEMQLPPDDSLWEEQGIRIAPISPQRFKRDYEKYVADFPDGASRVVAIKPGSEFEALKIRPGDVIFGMNDWSAGSAAAWESIAKELKKKQTPKITQVFFDRNGTLFQMER